MTPHACRLSALLVALFASAPAFAFRCNAHLIMEGDPQERVLEYCGEPASAHRHVVYRSGITAPYWRRGPEAGRTGALREEILAPGQSVVEILVEEWVYNFGPHRLMQRVRFENGVVTDTEFLDYGYSRD